LPTKRRISSTTACLPACLPIAVDEHVSFASRWDHTLIIQVLGLGSKPQFWFWYLFGSGLHVWALTGGHVCRCVWFCCLWFLVWFWLFSWALVMGINIFF
jgi:hypothetical protein